MDADLRAILGAYPASCRPLAEPERLDNAGGLSGARLWRFTAPRGRLVARCWPPDGPARAALERIHGWLGELGHLGFVPVPLPGQDGRTLRGRGGRLWEVAPWMPGAADLAPTAARWRAGLVGLAAFHLALAQHAREAPSPGLGERCRELEALLMGGFATLERAVDRAGADPHREPARRWLGLARRVAPRLVEPLRRATGVIARVQPCLRDARPEHLLFEGDRLSGLVDFGAMGFDVISTDLARLLAEWFGPDRPARAEALAAYTAVRPLDPTESALIAAFDRSAALLGAGRWVRWHFLDGRTFDDPQAIARGLARGLDRLARLVAEHDVWGTG